MGTSKKTKQINSFYIGRFQPFHLGHLHNIESIIQSGEFCIIGLGSSNLKLSSHNPLTTKERITIIQKVLISKNYSKKHYKIVEIPDINNNNLWVEHVRKIIKQPFEKIYTGSDLVNQLFTKDKRYKVIKLKLIKTIDNQKLNATIIRNKILNQEPLTKYLHRTTLKYLSKLDLKARLVKLQMNINKNDNQKTMTKVNPNIFRAYDIRGKAMSKNKQEIDLTEESVYLITRGIATYMRKKLDLADDKMLHVVIGRDCRLTGSILIEAMVKGLEDTNCKIANINLATSPMVYYSTCKYGFDLGLVLTASHNHKDDNGIKIVEKNAHSVCGIELQEILKLVQKHDFYESTKKGTYYDMDVFNDYVKDIVEKLPLAKLCTPLKVAVDTGNGVVGKFIGKLLKSAGCDVVELFTELDGNYPNHEANPEYAKNLTELIKTVVKEKCDIGFGFDGDGDRVGVIDEKGNHYASDQIIILLARDILTRKPGASIVFDVKCSKLLEDEIIKNGGKAIIEKTGHSFIENRMKQENAPLAGEVSGHIFIAEDYYGYDDAMFAALKILKILSEKKSGNNNVNFSDLLSDLPETHTTSEIKVACPDNKKFEIVKKASEFFEQKYDCLTIDGVKIHFSEYTWGLIRSSNTSAYLTLRFEATSKKELQKIQLQVAGHLQQYPELDTSWTNKI